MYGVKNYYNMLISNNITKRVVASKQWARRQSHAVNPLRLLITILSRGQNYYIYPLLSKKLDFTKLSSRHADNAFHKSFITEFYFSWDAYALRW